jgi:hypothetical protein
MKRLGFVVVAALLLGGCALQPGEDGSGDRSGEGYEELMRNEGAISAPGSSAGQGNRSPTTAQQQQHKDNVRERIKEVLEPEPTPWQQEGSSGGSGGSSGSGENKR